MAGTQQDHCDPGYTQIKYLRQSLATRKDIKRELANPLSIQFVHPHIALRNPILQVPLEICLVRTVLNSIDFIKCALQEKDKPRVSRHRQVCSLQWTCNIPTISKYQSSYSAISKQRKYAIAHLPSQTPGPQPLLKGKYYKCRIVTVTVYLSLHASMFINTHLDAEVPPSIFFGHSLQQFVWVDIGFSENMGWLAFEDFGLHGIRSSQFSK